MSWFWARYTWHTISHKCGQWWTIRHIRPRNHSLTNGWCKLVALMAMVIMLTSNGLVHQCRYIFLPVAMCRAHRHDTILYIPNNTNGSSTVISLINYSCYYLQMLVTGHLHFINTNVLNFHNWLTELGTLRSTPYHTKKCHFRKIFPSQSVGMVLKKLT